MLHVEVESDTCISSGRCVADAPTAFGFDEDEIAVALPGAAALRREALIEIARQCPSGAIVVHEDAAVLDLD